MKISLSRINIFLVLLYIVVVVPLWGGLVKDGPSSWPALAAISRPIVQERQKIRAQSKIALLNLLMPSQFGDLAGVSRSGLDPQAVDWDQYIRYYQQAVLVLPAPWNADAYAMLGFCFYHQGKIKESTENYVKALEANPALIWNYTNTAYLFFKQGDYPNVVMLLNQGLAINPEVSVQILSSSKIYTDILRDAKGGVNWPAELKQTYSDAARMLVISLYRLGKFPEVKNAAQYAVSSGFEPSAFFEHYIGLSWQALGEQEKARKFLLGGASGLSENILTGQDLSVRIF